MRKVYTGFCFIQGLVETGLYRILFYSWFGSYRFIKDSVLFRVWLRQVYTGFCFIQGSVQTGLYSILFYSGFGKDRFIEDSVLLTDREGQRIQCPKEKLQNTKNKQIVHGTKGHLA